MRASGQDRLVCCREFELVHGAPRPLVSGLCMVVTWELGEVTMHAQSVIFGPSWLAAGVVVGLASRLGLEGCFREATQA